MPVTGLITLAEYRTQMNLETVEDMAQHIGAAINHASAIMADYCQREFLLSSCSEVFHGNGSYRYYATHCRVLAKDQYTSVTAPTLSFYQGTASGLNWLETTRSWVVDSDKGRIWFTDPAHTFWTSDHRPNWKLDYWYGWPQSDIPQAIKYLCGRMAHLLLQQAEHDGTASQSFAGGTTSYVLNALPADIIAILNQYRSPRCFEC